MGRAELSLDIAPALTWEVGRALTGEDLARKQTAAPVAGSRPPPLQRLRARHHRAARLIAEGLGRSEVSVMVGLTPERFSQLAADPSFTELVKVYQREIADEYQAMHAKIAGLAADAADELAERLENEPGAFDNDQLMKLLEKAADRSGFGPSSSTQVNVSVGLADRLKAARQRVRTRQAEDAEIIDGDDENSSRALGRNSLTE